MRLNPAAPVGAVTREVKMWRRRLFRGWACLALVGIANQGLAQDESETYVQGVPLENAIVGRPCAFLLRGEWQTTEDDDELLDQNASYVTFPSEIFNADLNVYREDGTKISAILTSWQNEQDLDVARWGWTLRTPIGRSWRLSVQHSRWNWVNDVNRHYFYLAMDKQLTPQIYSYTQVRHRAQRGESGQNQLLQYLSWRPNRRTRIGMQAAATDVPASVKDDSWQVKMFGSLYIWKDLCSLRADARHYDSGTDLVYQDYNAYLYQRLGRKSLLRLSARYYHDNEDRTSRALGVRVKHQLTPRYSLYAGYRWYDHSEGVDFDTFNGGFSALF